MKKIFLTFLFVLSVWSCFDVSASAEEWLWPVPGNLHIYQPFKSTHSGLDISQNTYHIVYAVKSGTVKTSKPYVCTHFSKPNSSDHSSSCAWTSDDSLLTLGNYIEIDHGDGTMSRYGHLCYGFNNSASGVTIPIVKVGDYIQQGTPIGIVGSSGHSFGQHLHFTIKKNGKNFNANPANNSLITSNNSKYSNSDICNGGTINYVNASNLYKKPGQTPSTPPDTEAPKFDFHGVDDNITISGTYKFWWKQTGYGNCDVNMDINGTPIGTLYQDANGYFSYEFDSTKYPNGTYTFGAIIRSTSGIEKYVTRTINIENSASFNGVVDACSGGNGTVYVRGWAYDASDIAKSIEVHVYIGGSAGVGEGHVITANGERADVNNVYGCGNYHGFEGAISTNLTGSQDVYIYAVNGEKHKLLDTIQVDIQGKVTVTNAPSAVSISTNKDMFALGETITFMYTSDCAEEFFIYISDTADWMVVMKGSELGECYSSKQSFSVSSLPAGRYYAYITGRNSVGHLDSSGIYFSVYESAPQEMKISVDKSMVPTNEEINFSYTSDCAQEYFIYICNAVDWSVVVKGSELGEYYSTSPTFKISTLPAGKYYAYVTGKNSIGHLDSAGIYFSIYDSAPKNVEIAVAKNENLIGDSVEFTYTSDCAEEYFIYISDISDWSVVMSGSDLGACYSVSTSYSISTLPVGDYCAYVTGKNRRGHLDSGRVYFSVSEPRAHIVSKAVKSGGLHTVNTALFNIDSGVLVVAGYKGGQMVDKTAVPCGADMPDAKLNGDIDEIKVMVWDALGSFKPVCEMEVIPESEFVTE